MRRVSAKTQRRVAAQIQYAFVLFLLFAGFSLTVDRFLTANNLLNIIQQISMLTIVGAGLTFGFAAREMDLSVGYMVGMAGIIVPFCWLPAHLCRWHCLPVSVLVWWWGPSMQRL